MKIEQYISLTVVLMVGLFVANALWPEVTFAKVRASTCPTRVQCYAPVRTWNVPAGAGSSATGTVCTTYVPSAKAPVYQVATSADSAWDLLGSILRTPFEMGQCILGGPCP
jgi:hypothetical protein